MNDVKCTIPADMLRYTVSALDELAIRQKMQAEKPGVPALAVEELLEQSAKVKKVSDFYFELYMQREGTV